MEFKEGLFMVPIATAIAVYLGPLVAFGWARSFVRYSPYSYLFTALSSGLWVFYGVGWGLAALWRLSLMGTILGAAYVLVFLWFSDPNDPRLVYLLWWTRGGAALLVGAIALDHFFPKSTIYGVICCAASAAPFYNLPTVRGERSMSTMPFIVIPIFGLINAIAWTIRNTKGVALKDIDYNLVIASCVAALCSLGQLVLHAVFWFWRPLPPPPRTGVRAPLLNKADGAGEGLPQRVEVSEKSTDGQDPDNENGGVSSRSSCKGQLSDAAIPIIKGADVSSGSSGNGQLSDGEDPSIEEGDVSLGGSDNGKLSNAEKPHSKDGDVSSVSGGNDQLGDREYEHRVAVASSSDEDAPNDASKVAQQRNVVEDGGVSSRSCGNVQLGDGKREHLLEVASSSDEEFTNDTTEVTNDAAEVAQREILKGDAAA